MNSTILSPGMNTFFFSVIANFFDRSCVTRCFTTFDVILISNFITLGIFVIMQNFSDSYIYIIIVSSISNIIRWDDIIF